MKGWKSLLNKKNILLRKEVLNKLNNVKTSKDGSSVIAVGKLDIFIAGENYSGKNAKLINETYFGKLVKIDDGISAPPKKKIKFDKMKCFDFKVWNSKPNTVTPTFGTNPSKWQFGLGKSKQNLYYFEWNSPECQAHQTEINHFLQTLKPPYNDFTLLYKEMFKISDLPNSN